jgi:hypothetical protein
VVSRVLTVRALHFTLLSSHQDFLHCWVLVLLGVLNEPHLRGLEKEARCASAQQGACKAAIRALELEAEAMSLHAYGRHVAATRRESSSESDVYR